MSRPEPNDPQTEASELIHAGEQENLLLSAFLTAAGAPGGVDPSVHRADEMFAYALGACHNSWSDALVLYHQGGLSAWRLAEQLLDLVAADDRRWLDFGCGFGRVLRFAVAARPGLAITGCDIDARAVEFVARRHGVGGLVSSHRPGDFEGAGEQDLVTAQSVFTHLPEATFGDWLARLWEQVAPGGVLAVSTNDLEAMPEGIGDPGTGFVFERTSESDDLSHELYGTTWVGREWMEERLGSVAGGECVFVERLPRALWNAQDLWIVGRRGGADPSWVTPEPTPLGYLDGVELVSGRRVKLAGWCMAGTAGEGAGAAATAVRVRVLSSDGAVLSEASPGELARRQDLEETYGARLEGGAWTLDLDLARPLRGDELLVVTAAGWPVHVSLLDGADRRARLERRIHELEVGQRILKAELERRGGLPLRFARALARRLAARR